MCTAKKRTISIVLIGFLAHFCNGRVDPAHAVPPDDTTLSLGQLIDAQNTCAENEGRYTLFTCLPILASKDPDKRRGFVSSEDLGDGNKASSTGQPAIWIEFGNEQVEVPTQTYGVFQLSEKVKTADRKTQIQSIYLVKYLYAESRYFLRRMPEHFERRELSLLRNEVGDLSRRYFGFVLGAALPAFDTVTFIPKDWTSDCTANVIGKNGEQKIVNSSGTQGLSISIDDKSLANLERVDISCAINAAQFFARQSLWNTKSPVFYVQAN